MSNPSELREVPGLESATFGIVVDALNQTNYAPSAIIIAVHKIIDHSKTYIIFLSTKILHF